MKHLLKLMDLSPEEITDILNLADQLKYEKKNGIEHQLLKNKTLGMIFQKSSTRTRVSFEAGMYELGGNALFLSSNDLQIGRGEPVEDTARVLSRYIDGIMIRTFAQEEVETLAKYASIPVINGLTDYTHPCQVLADLMTIREYKGTLAGLKLTYIGDGNNMANSLMMASRIAGIHFEIGAPEEYKPSDAILNNTFGGSGTVSWTKDPAEAVKDADFIYTDVWVSMGFEEEAKERMRILDPYRLDMATLKKAKPGAMVMHCLPAHRGEEITEEVLEAHANEIFDEAENRLHAQKAVLVACMK